MKDFYVLHRNTFTPNEKHSKKLTNYPNIKEPVSKTKLYRPQP
jgi:hypothetical protein